MRTCRGAAALLLLLLPGVACGSETTVCLLVLLRSDTSLLVLLRSDTSLLVLWWLCCCMHGN
jgi:hypothetical protein